MRRYSGPYCALPRLSVAEGGRDYTLIVYPIACGATTDGEGILRDMTDAELDELSEQFDSSLRQSFTFTGA